MPVLKPMLKWLVSRHLVMIHTVISQFIRSIQLNLHQTSPVFVGEKSVVNLAHSQCGVVFHPHHPHLLDTGLNNICNENVHINNTL